MWYELASNRSSLCLNLQSERLVGMQGAQQVSVQQDLSAVLPLSVQQGAGQEGALLLQGMQLSAGLFLSQDARQFAGQQGLYAVLPQSVQQVSGPQDLCAMLPLGVQQGAGQT